MCFFLIVRRTIWCHSVRFHNNINPVNHKPFRHIENSIKFTQCQQMCKLTTDLFCSNHIRRHLYVECWKLVHKLHYWHIPSLIVLCTLCPLDCKIGLLLVTRRKAAKPICMSKRGFAQCLLLVYCSLIMYFLFFYHVGTYTWS